MLLDWEAIEPASLRWGRLRVLESEASIRPPVTIVQPWRFEGSPMCFGLHITLWELAILQ
jgi:hypothetical protein